MQDWRVRSFSGDALHWRSLTCFRWCFEGQYQGLAPLSEFNLFIARIAIASFMAYLLGQIIDVHVFNRLSQMKQWWVAPTCSTLFGNALDTIAFFSIAFYQCSDPFMAEH